jgi:exodeoxyribonuclease V alpha subunit
MKETVEGVICEIIYVNETNGYTVCAAENDSEQFVAVGIMPGISPGETVLFTGEWTSHSEYGPQFRVSAFESVMPKTEMQILMYLSTGVIKGIGPATAQKIVEKFGEKSLDVLRDEPLKLAKIKGISERKALEMHESFMAKQLMQNIVMFLSQYGVTPQFAVKVFNKFGAESVSKIRENPYIICEIEGIGFKTADKIAFLMGVDYADKNRLLYGVLYVLYERAHDGDTFVERHELIRECEKLLSADKASIESAFMSLVSEGKVILEKIDGLDAVYLPFYYNAEHGTAKMLAGLCAKKPSYAIHGFEEIIKKIEREQNIEFSKEQKKACQFAAVHNVLIITGGPGTGKTTIINAIIEMMERANLSVALSAPTGRAAKRLTETCGIEGKTIHRLLEINFSEGERQHFARCEGSPLSEDVVIVDEISMADITLMYALLKALKPTARIIMAGDADQLPSVGAGNVLRDMIKSGKVPTIRLEEIYRQAAESMIIVNAHRINGGEEPILNKKDKDFFCIERTDGTDISKTLADLCTRRIPKAYGFSPMTDIQVITPAKRTMLGVYELNKILQKRLNPPCESKAEKRIGDLTFREGDKVMQVKNNYDIKWVDKTTGKEGEGVFNGDIGVIEYINSKEQELCVLYDGERLVKYDFETAAELELAYAVTVHKSQGSEFPVVIMPLYPFAPMLMNRNLLYTAVTRAKKLVVLVGREAVLKKMIENNRETKRFSGLKFRLENLI